jgi:hypothetical protein
LLQLLVKLLLLVAVALVAGSTAGSSRQEVQVLQTGF